VIGLEVKLVEQKQGKSTNEKLVIALIWGAWNLKVILDPDIKANLTLNKSENVRVLIILNLGNQINNQ